MPILVIALAYVGIMIYLANVEQVKGELQPLLTMMQYGLSVIIGVLVLNALALLMLSPEQVNDPILVAQLDDVNKLSLGVFIGVGTMAIGLIIWLIRSPIPHRWIEQTLYSKSKNTLRIYDSTLSVHKTALMLAILQVVSIVWTLALTGGTSGLDFTYDTPISALADVTMSAVMYIVIALLGVGWMIRRDNYEVVERLGLRLPTRRDIVLGIGTAFVLYIVLMIGSDIWTASVSPEVLEQQTSASRQLFSAFSGSLILGFLLALLTGISEEILFRGALQPVFGLIPTAIFFTILHIQYALTPATLILFVVALGFGCLRQRVSTTAAIIAHITFNFVQFLLLATIINSPTGVI